MKKVTEKIIQMRNPEFRFDGEISGAEVMQFFMRKTMMLFRGGRMLFHFRKTKFVLLGKNVKFFHIRKIKLGKFVQIDDYVSLSALGKGGITIGDNSGIGAFSRVIVSTSMHHTGAFIRIGNNVGIGEFAYLGGAGGLEIGDDCIIGQYFSCHPENHNYEKINTHIRHQGVTRKGIKIGADCWIGSKVTILDGVEIGEGCVIAAGAVVTKNMPPFSVIGGVPAKVIKSRKNNQETAVIRMKAANA